jgi:hypothetical protein
VSTVTLERISQHLPELIVGLEQHQKKLDRLKEWRVMVPAMNGFSTMIGANSKLSS